MTSPSGSSFDIDALLPSVGCRGKAAQWAALLAPFGLEVAQLLRRDAGAQYSVQAPAHGLKLTVAWLGEGGDPSSDDWGLVEVALDHQQHDAVLPWASAAWRGIDAQQCSLKDAKAALGDDCHVAQSECSFFVHEADGRTLVFALRWQGPAKSSTRLAWSSVTHLGGFLMRS